MSDSSTSAAYGGRSSTGNWSNGSTYFPMPNGSAFPAGAELDLDPTVFPVSSQVSTTWNFTPAPPPDPTKATGTVPSLPSIGRRRCGRPRSSGGRAALQIDLRVGHLVRSPSSEITGARLSYSIDGGVQWTPAVVVSTKDGYRAIVPPRALSPGSSLSLRATATDAAGSSIDQTVIGAIPVQ